MKSTFSPKYETFRNRLIEARKKAGLTQESLAKLLDKPQSFVAKYENGERRLDVIEFIYISKALVLDPIKIVKELAK